MCYQSLAGREPYNTIIYKIKNIKRVTRFLQCKINNKNIYSHLNHVFYFSNISYIQHKLRCLKFNIHA